MGFSLGRLYRAVAQTEAVSFRCPAYPPVGRPYSHCDGAMGIFPGAGYWFCLALHRADVQFRCAVLAGTCNPCRGGGMRCLDDAALAGELDAEHVGRFAVAPDLS